MKRVGAAAASVIGGLVLIGGLLAGGAVLASDNTVEGAAGERAGEALRPRLLAGAYHAEGTWLLIDGATRTTTGDAGAITAVGADSLTLLRADGQEVTASVTGATCIRKEGRPATLPDLGLGDRAVVVQSEGSALAIRSGFARRGVPCGLLRPVVHGDVTVDYLDGSTRTMAYDPAMITAIREGEISLTRRDGQSVSLSYDYSTVVIDEGRVASIEDLKAGDRAMLFSEDGKALLIRCIKSSEGPAPSEPPSSETQAQAVVALAFIG